MKEITEFKGDYDFLANDFNDCKIYIEKDDLTYTNLESALIAQKSDDFGTRRKFTRFNAMKARKKLSTIPDNDEWEENKDEIMKDLLRIKFKKGSKLGKKLVETIPAKLINTVTYPDEYYGVRYGEGKNMLGKMLMEIRDEIK